MRTLRSWVDHQPKPWQQRSWIQLLAILLGVVPVYALAILNHLSRERPYTLNEIFFYAAVVGGVATVWLLLLLRYPCGEGVGALNLKSGRWWKDSLAGIALALLTFGIHTLLQTPLNETFPREPVSGLAEFFNGLARNPWLFVFFMGPVLLVGVAVFEELARVFLLTRLWHIWSGTAWRWFAVVLSALLFGLAHIYQGPAGVVDSFINGLILAVSYLIIGRFLPLIIAHYLYDAVQIVMVVLLIWWGVIQF